MHLPSRHASLLALLSVGLSAAGWGCGSDTPAGLRIDVDLNGQQPELLRIAVSASPNGFMMPMGSGNASVTVETETDASGQPGVVLRFQNPQANFGPRFSFLLDTRNTGVLTMTASALGFANNRLIVAADAASTTLSPGSQSRIPLVLHPQQGQVAPNTRTTDLGRDVIDVTIKGRWPNAHLSALASCNVDGQAGREDIIIGAPTSRDLRDLGAVGAVHVVLGGVNIPADIDLEIVGPSREFHIYGAGPFDELGFSVACADLDGDGVGDIIAGAPGAANGQGRVYLIFGHPGIAVTTIDLGSNMGQNVYAWESPVPAGRFGAQVFALPAVTDVRPGMVLVSAPGVGTVHVLAPPTTKPAMIQTVDVTATAHTTISGVAANAVVAGHFTALRDAGGPLDVAVADSMLHPGGDGSKQGVVYVFHDVGPTPTTAFSATATDTLGPAVTMIGGDNSLFGQALAVLDAGVGEDLLVGAPNEMNGAGRVYIFKNDSMFFEVRNPTTEYHLDGPMPGGRFGWSLAVGVSGTLATGAQRLLVGAPDTTRGERSGAGAAYLFAPSQDHTFELLDQVFGAAMDHHLGTAVAGGQIDVGNTISDLIASAPGADGNGGNNGAGIVYIRFNREFGN